MSGIGKTERATQDRIISLFRNQLDYEYLGNWTHRDKNSNIEEKLLTKNLRDRGYTAAQISGALYQLHNEADNAQRGLYGNNKAVYSLLRYGVKVQTAAGQKTETVFLIDWKNPKNNHFAFAEEVTLQGDHERRPDIVLYVNGIAIGVLELKRSSVSIGDGIRQNLSNQQEQFHARFFSTVQFVFAGSDAEGLRYGTILTPEKMFLQWKEDEQENADYKLDKYLLKMCRQDRLIELMYDFVLFDGGIKKLPRVHQYFAIQEAHPYVVDRKSGIIWHTQGSGKSIVMVLLARWILENRPAARVAIVTDRDELDKQIERVFSDAGETIARASSARDLMTQLGQAAPRLLCSLIHKFGKKGVDDFEVFIKELEQQPALAVGELFVFVDECHRTQSGKLHRIMKALLPDATFIGFTGTPLLKKDKQTTLEVFGRYIHTYKFGEAVEDKVVLDLVYEARDIDQDLSSQAKVDAWFEAKTRALNTWQKDELKKHWGTMQKVLSSQSRKEKVVNDIVFDFEVKPRISNERGNAMLVAASIYDACRYYELFQKSPLKGKCAVITSYNPQTRDITTEDTGENTETEKEYIYNTYTDLLKNVTAASGKTKTETYEDAAKLKFIKEPALMKLLIVVDKLLTGFDAPSCTYLYIDKSMQDHGLFQAICRTNRLDGEDKDFGYIVDYKDLFKKVENAIEVYTSELDDADPEESDPNILLKSRLARGYERLETARVVFALLGEPVAEPKSELDYIHYFCGNTEIPDDLQEREPKRTALYHSVVSFVRAYANIADELEAAGYTPADIVAIKKELDDAIKLRDIIRNASNEKLDLKTYEADMRYLIDKYIEADEPRRISDFENVPLLELISNRGISEAIATLPEGIKSDQSAVAETIVNNVRSKIIQEQLSDPAYYERMSQLLEEIIADRKLRALEYEDYLKRLAELAKSVQAGKADDTPVELNSPGKRALYNNLFAVLSEGTPVTTGTGHIAETTAPYTATQQKTALELALRIDTEVKRDRPDDWRGNEARENTIKRTLYGILNSVEKVEQIFPIIVQQKEY